MSRSIFRSACSPRPQRHGRASGSCRQPTCDCVFPSLAAFSLHFFRQSVISGIDVARIAFDPRLPLRAGFVVYRCRLRSAGELGAFCALSSLLPGTLPTGANEDGDLLIHCLDVTQPGGGQSRRGRDLVHQGARS